MSQNIFREKVQTDAYLEDVPSQASFGHSSSEHTRCSESKEASSGRSQGDPGRFAARCLNTKCLEASIGCSAMLRKSSMKWKCNWCGAAFGFPSHLRNHERKHTDERPFKCHVCERTFKQNNHFRHHLSSIHNVGSRFYCRVCHKGFHHEEKMKKHMIVHEPCDCSECGMILPSSIELKRHIKVVHHTRCEICNRKFSRTDYYRKHLVTKMHKSKDLERKLVSNEVGCPEEGPIDLSRISSHTW